MSIESAGDPFIAAASLDGVPSGFASARDGIDALLRDRGLRQTTPEITAESLLRGAAATATLETGVSISPEELTAGSGDPTARAALRLSTELLGLLPDWKRSPVQVIARMHSIAAKGSVPDADLGQPVRPEGVARLRELARLLSLPTKAPGLVVAALVHAELSAADAFASHNGVIARAAERLVLVATGVDPASVIVPEAGHMAAPKSYVHALDAYRAGDADGVHSWLLYAADAFARGAEASPFASR